MVDFNKALRELRAKNRETDFIMEHTQAEKDSAVFTTSTQNENEVFIELLPGEHVDCQMTELQQPTGRMSSPMLHGYEVLVSAGRIISIDESKPIKMWAPRSLEQAYTINGGRLIGQSVRIRRLEDVPIGGTMFAKAYRISALKSLLVLLAKDKPATK